MWQLSPEQVNAPLFIEKQREKKNANNRSLVGGDIFINLLIKEKRNVLKKYTKTDTTALEKLLDIT